MSRRLSLDNRIKALIKVLLLIVKGKLAVAGARETGGNVIASSPNTKVVIGAATMGVAFRII